MSCASFFLTVVPTLQHDACSGGSALPPPCWVGAPALDGTSPHVPGSHPHMELGQGTSLALEHLHNMQSI